MLSRYSLVTNDLTLPAKISALVTLGKVIKPFSIVPTRCFWWMQTISQTERLHSVTNNKSGAVSILTPCSVLV
jgi:hypothetical protein